MKITFLTTHEIMKEKYVQQWGALTGDFSADVINAPHLLEGFQNGEDDVRMRSQLLKLVEKSDADVFVCTCSTLGVLVDKLVDDVDTTLIRIDKAMMKEVVHQHTSIALVYTARSTLNSSLSLLRQEAEDQQSSPEVSTIDATAAWSYLGHDQSKYLDMIYQAIMNQYSGEDAIVLAQGSLADLRDYSFPFECKIYDSVSAGLQELYKEYVYN